MEGQSARKRRLQQNLQHKQTTPCNSQLLLLRLQKPTQKNLQQKKRQSAQKKKKKKEAEIFTAIGMEKKKKGNNNGDKQRQMQPLLLGYWDLGTSAPAGGRRVGCGESKLILQQMHERALNPSLFPTNTRTITIIVVMVMTPLHHDRHGVEHLSS